MRIIITCIFITIVFLLESIVHAQNGNAIAITNDLFLTKLTDNAYIHTSNNNNGIIYTVQNEAVIVSTPADDSLTLALIRWVQEEMGLTIIAYVIDRWHPDAMEGLDVIKNLGIKSYANKRTLKTARKKNLPLADIGFNKKLNINIQGQQLVCHYFGPAHTHDGIVVWLPAERILFGGNGIRNYNGWAGNIGDANIKKWSQTATKIKEAYGNAHIVVPGHGTYGGPELLDYTVGLYTQSKWSSVLWKYHLWDKEAFYNHEEILVFAESDSTNTGIHYLNNALVFIERGKGYYTIESPYIQHDTEKKILRANSGILTYYKKRAGNSNPAEKYYFQRLVIFIRDDEVDMVIAIRNFIW